MNEEKLTTRNETNHPHDQIKNSVSGGSGVGVDGDGDYSSSNNNRKNRKKSSTTSLTCLLLIILVVMCLNSLGYQFKLTHISNDYFPQSQFQSQSISLPLEENSNIINNNIHNMDLMPNSDSQSYYNNNNNINNNFYPNNNNNNNNPDFNHLLDVPPEGSPPNLPSIPTWNIRC